MSKFHSFLEFIREEKVTVPPVLKEYVVKDLGDGKYEMEKDNSPVQFSVLPVPKDLDTYHDIMYEIMSAVKSNIPSKLYEVIQKVEKLPYDFGNVFSTSLSLSNVNGLSVALTDDQRVKINASEIDFLKTDFASLSQRLKDAILSYLRDLAETAAVVLECLFHYTATGEKDEFFEGKNFDELLSTYNKIIDECKQKDEVSFDGPYDSEKMRTKLETPHDFAYWKIALRSKNLHYMLRAPVSPKILNSDDNVGNKTGMNFTILTSELKELSKDYTRFPANDLGEKIDNILNG